MNAEPKDRPAEGREARREELRSYLIGFALSLVLTLAAFAPVAFPGLLDRTTTYSAIGLLAALQIVVQFRCFLHIDLSRQKREDLYLILFTTLILGLMIFGTLWIMLDLYGRMAPGMLPAGM